MKPYKLILIDMFQTLVDVDTRKLIVGQRILKDSYTEQLGLKCWNEATELVIDYFGKKELHESYETVKHGFEKCYEVLRDQKHYDIDPKESARILAEEHGKSVPYEDAEAFIRNIGAMFPICLVSDSDLDMIEPLLQLFAFDQVFVSEAHRCYKSNGKLLKAALDAYGVLPHEALHIGDGFSDVFGARSLGMDVCWLNRNGRSWKHEIAPTFIVEGLKELEMLLLDGVAEDSAS